MAGGAMYGGRGMSPRKAMSSGVDVGSSNFGVGGYPGRGHTPHPDRGMSHSAMDDGDRGVGHPIKHSNDHHPAQAAPRHGPGHESKMGFQRGGKV